MRGAGYFYGIELVKDKTTREMFNDDESERLLVRFLSKALFAGHRAGTTAVTPWCSSLPR